MGESISKAKTNEVVTAEELNDNWEELELTLKNMKIGLELLIKEIATTTECLQFFKRAYKESLKGITDNGKIKN